MSAFSSLSRPFLLGVVTGSRSQLGPALLAWSPDRKDDPRTVRLLRTKPGRLVTTLAAAGEIVADKLPRTPSRLKPPVLGARLVGGAVIGAQTAGDRTRTSTALGALAGVAGAAAGSWLGATARTTLPAKTGTPDLLWAVIEDAAAVALGAAVLRGR